MGNQNSMRPQNASAPLRSAPLHSTRKTPEKAGRPETATLCGFPFLYMTLVEKHACKLPYLPVEEKTTHILTPESRSSWTPIGTR
jgi:hypothetical protein